MLCGWLRALEHQAHIDVRTLHKHVLHCTFSKLSGPCGPMVKALVFTRNMRGADVLLASVVTTRLSRLESWQGRQTKKPRRSIPNVRFVIPARFHESQTGT